MSVGGEELAMGIHNLTRTFLVYQTAVNRVPIHNVDACKALHTEILIKNTKSIHPSEFFSQQALITCATRCDYI